MTKPNLDSLVKEKLWEQMCQRIEQKEQEQRERDRKYGYYKYYGEDHEPYWVPGEDNGDD